MTISIHQPDYISYLGYFHKMFKANTFVYLDDAQFSNDNMHHWNRIKTPQGEFRLKIPLEYKFGQNINQVRTKDELGWKEKHLKTIEMNYKKAEFFPEIFPEFKEILLQEYGSLAEMNIGINTWIGKRFGFQCLFLESSKMNIDTYKEERVIDIVRALKGSVYLSGNGAKVYQSSEHFEQAGISLKYTDYEPIVYTQLWGSFIPNLSILDYLFNMGFDWSFIENKLKNKEL